MCLYSELSGSNELEKDKTKLAGDIIPMRQVLEKFKNMLKDEPGLMTGVSHEINMGELKPCRTMPYRICPAWREAIKDEIYRHFF